jgi:hypothetical protein
MPRNHIPSPLRQAEVIESLAVASLALRFVAETGAPLEADLGDAPRYLRDLVKLREAIRVCGLPRSLVGAVVAGRGARRGGG